MSGFPYIFTFYSYKGGVGRSMALLNTAYALAGRGRHVLVIDADLDAPGLSEFLSHAEGEVAGSSELDIVDLLSWALQMGNTLGEKADQGDLDVSEAPILASFAAPAPPEQLKKMAPRLGWVGRLDFITADLERDYFARLEKIGLPSMNRDHLLRAAKVIRRYLKTRRIETTFPGVEDLIGPEEVPYDYILVDSRTGLTAAGGLCIGPLADRLVVVTALNDQNVRGTKRFLDIVGLDRRREDVTKPWDAADVPPSAPEAPPRLAPKPTLIVASPVPVGELEYKHRRLEEVGASIGPVAAKLSYHTRMAVVETVFVRDFPDEYLAKEYDELADRMMAAVDDHAAQLARHSQKLWNDEKRYADAVEKVVRLTPHQPDLGESLLRDLSNRFELSDETNFATVYRLYACLSGEGAHDRDIALGRWGSALSREAKTKHGAEADALFEKAYEKYAEAVEIKPDKTVTLNNWGVALSDQAETKQGPEADRLFEEAYDKFAEASRIEPDQHEVFGNWGDALSRQGKTKEGAEADALFEEAYQKCAKAVEIKPDFHHGFNNWGAALVRQGETKDGVEADALFAKAYEKLAEALRIKPDMHKALSNWGAGLCAQAETKQGSEADALFEEACQKLSEAVRFKPDYAATFNNWGHALLGRGRTRQGAEAERLFEEARAKLSRVEEIEAGAGSYNLACLAALQGRGDECREWLIRAGETGRLHSAEKLAQDADLDNVRETEWFKEFLAGLA